MSRQFLYCLMDEQNRFYYENNGGVSVSTIPKPLTYTPNKWLDIEIERQRNANLFALDRSFTVPIEAVKDGALIIKHIYYNQWIEGKLYLAILDQRLFIDETHYGFYYSLLHKGEIDLSQFDHDGPVVVINVMEGGVAKLLKANFNTKYEIPLTGGIQVQMDGIKLNQKASWVVGGLVRDNCPVPMTFISQEAISSIGAQSQNGARVANVAPDLWNSGERFLEAGAKDALVKLNWKFKVTAKADVPFGDENTYLQLKVVTLEGDSVISEEIIQEEFSPNIDDIQNRLFEGTKTFTAPANSRIVLYMTILLYANQVELTYHPEDSLITAEYTYTHQSTLIHALRPADLYKKVCAKMGITNAVSPLLEQYNYIVVTSGDGVRGLQNAVIKTSLSDLFTSFNTVLCTGMGVFATDGGTLSLGKKGDFVKYTNPIPLGVSKKPRVKPAKDYIFNTIKIGYPNQNYDDVNGKYEFNTTQVYTAPITRESKELNLVSVYRADSYGIEFTRINLEGKATTDSGSDNDVFMLHVSRTPVYDQITRLPLYYTLDRTLNNYATGIPEINTVFNLWLSPKQCFYRNGSFIRSCFYKMNNGIIKYQTSDKASALKVEQPGQRIVDEDSDVEIGTLDAPLFTPNLIEFETKVPFDLQELLKPDPLRSFQFTIDGVDYIGFPVKDSLKPANNESQTFTVLSAPSNQLEKLIAYNG